MFLLSSFILSVFFLLVSMLFSVFTNLYVLYPSSLQLAFFFNPSSLSLFLVYISILLVVSFFLSFIVLGLSFLKCFFPGRSKFVFGIFKHNHNFTTYKCETLPCSIWHLDSNSLPLGHESPSITTRPILHLPFVLLFCLFLTPSLSLCIYLCTLIGIFHRVTESNHQSIPTLLK